MQIARQKGKEMRLKIVASTNPNIPNLWDKDTMAYPVNTNQGRKNNNHWIVSPSCVR